MLTLKRTFALAFTIVLLASPASASAQGLGYGTGVPAGTTVDHDVLLIGQDVFIDGTVNGNAFVFGNQVRVDGTVDGSLVLIGQNATVAGQITGSVYAAALTLDLTAPAMVTRDLYVFTVDLTTQAASSIRRDLYALGLNAGLNGGIGGRLHTSIGPIGVYNALMHLLGFDELQIDLQLQLPRPQPVTPTPTAPTGAGLPPAGQSGRIATVSLAVPRRITIQSAPASFDWSAWALGVLRGWGALFVLGFLGYWLARKWFEAGGAPIRDHPWRTLGIGLIVLVVSLNLFGVGLLVAALCFVIGLGLSAIGLLPLALLLWILSYALIAILMSALWLLIAYFSKIITAYHLTQWAGSALHIARTWWIDVIALLIATLLYTLLRALPYVGWVIGILVVAMGMGSVWTAWRSPRPGSAPGVPAPVVAAPRRSR